MTDYEQTLQQARDMLKKGACLALIAQKVPIRLGDIMVLGRPNPSRKANDGTEGRETKG